jgi:hypothetical protein
MRIFHDAGRREWKIDVEAECISRVKEMTGILLLELVTTEGAQQIESDPLKLIEILYAVCLPEIEERSLSQKEFRKVFRGDALDEAVDALVAEIVDFFPKSRRTVVQTLVNKGKEVQEVLVRRITSDLNNLDPEKVVANLRGVNSGSSPASLESIPDTSPSEKSA